LQLHLLKLTKLILPQLIVQKTCKQPTIHTNCISTKYVTFSSRFLVDPQFNNFDTLYASYQPIVYNRPSYTSPNPSACADPLDPNTIDWNDTKRTIYGKFNFTPEGRPFKPNWQNGCNWTGVF